VRAEILDSVYLSSRVRVRVRDLDKLRQVSSERPNRINAINISLSLSLSLSLSARARAGDFGFMQGWYSLSINVPSLEH
jgi:hypothetical protein